LTNAARIGFLVCVLQAGQNSTQCRLARSMHHQRAKTVPSLLPFRAQPPPHHSIGLCHPHVAFPLTTLRARPLVSAVFAAGSAAFLRLPSLLNENGRVSGPPSNTANHTGACTRIRAVFFSHRETSAEVFGMKNDDQFPVSVGVAVRGQRT